MSLSDEKPAVRHRLRAVTNDIHEALHHAKPFAAIAAGSLERAGYGATLAFLHRYHAGLAPICGRGAVALHAPELAAAHQARIAALESDLIFLEVPVPPAPKTETSADGAFAAGCLYTVQGSTLGGKVIFRQLDYLLADEQGRSFFKGRAEDGRHWQKLCAALEEEGGSDELEKGALFAFALFRDLLETA